MNSMTHSKIKEKIEACLKSFTAIPSQYEFQNKFPFEYNDLIIKHSKKYNTVLVELGYDPFKDNVIKDYSDKSENQLLDFIKIDIEDFIRKYDYIPSEQIYKTLPLPSIAFLKIKFNLSFALMLKKIECDRIHGFKIYRHIPNDILLNQVKIKIDEFLLLYKKLPNRKSFNNFKIGSVIFYEKRFETTYNELLIKLGYSLSLKHKPLSYKEYSKTEIFDLTKNEILRFVNENGTVPTQFQYKKLDAPSEIYFKKRHNLTYNELLLKLGFNPINSGEKYKYMSNKASYGNLKIEINLFIRDKNRLPNAEEFQMLDVPSFGYIKKHYNFTFKELIYHLGYRDIDFIEGYCLLKERDLFKKIRDEIYTFKKCTGKFPTQKQYNTLNVPSSYIMKKLFNLTFVQLIKKIKEI